MLVFPALTLTSESLVLRRSNVTTVLCVQLRSIVLVSVLFSPAVFAQYGDAVELMRNMASATEKLNYDGTFIYQREAQIDSMRIVHRVDGVTERERLISLSGPEREVVRDGTRVTCLFADDREVMVEKTEPRNFLSLGVSEPVEQLTKNYTFSVAGQDRIAGRNTILVSIQPREANRYAYQLWIDQEFKLLLKSVILNRNGQLLEQVQFVQITIDQEIPDDLLQTEIEGSEFTWHTNSEDDNSAASVVETSGWTVKWLPSGFYMRNHKVQTMSESDMPVSHMVYSDGLAMVSVFVEQMVGDRQPLQGYSSMGAVNAFSRVSDNHQITVVGEVPLPTVRQIASSVEHTK
ncbi:MAG: sigma-E factor negative regulatory protein RseB [Gammaproteobacteria bacterium]|jgi:sigma-E factor negative regulatory protein RseB